MKVEELQQLAQANDRVRELLEQGWTQDVFARREDGTAVNPNSPEAVSFCISGGVHRAAREIVPEEDLSDLLTWHLKYIEDALGSRNPVIYNDDPERTQEDVIDLLDRVGRRIRKDVETGRR